MMFITKILCLVLTAIICILIPACRPNKSEKIAEISIAASAAQALKDAAIEQEIISIIDSTKVHPMWAPTIGNVIVEVFYNYEIVWKPYNDSEKYYEVSIGGDYCPNPDIKNLSYNGTITYLVDIETKECLLFDDPSNISAAFMLFIIN